MKIIARSIIHVVAVLVSISSSEHYKPVEQHIVNSSVSLIMGVGYFCLYQVVGILLMRVTSTKDHTEYHFEISDVESVATDTGEQEMKAVENDTESPHSSEKKPMRTSGVVYQSEEDELLDVWRVVYGIGFGFFVTYYSVDLTSVTSSVSFILGLLYMHAPHVYQMLIDNTGSSYDTMYRFIGIVSYVLCVFGVVIFVVTACTNGDQAPDSMQFCSGVTTLRMDIVAGILAPSVATTVVHECKSSHVYTLYKATPFSLILAVFVIIFSSTAALHNVVQNKVSDILFFLINPLTKGCATVAVITAAMQKQRVETATILAFLLFCKELHYNKGNMLTFKGICSSLILCTLSYVLCMLQGSRFALRKIYQACVP